MQSGGWNSKKYKKHKVEATNDCNAHSNISEAWMMHLNQFSSITGTRIKYETWKL